MKSRRGSIVLVIVFGTAMSIICLGMLRVASTLSSAVNSTTKQYADMFTMNSICDVACYEYIEDLMLCVATINLDSVMPGTPDATVYKDCLFDIQDSLAVEGNSLKWVVSDASSAVFYTGEISTEVQTKLLSIVSGIPHEFSLELLEDLSLDYTSHDTYIIEDRALIPLKPVTIFVRLKVKSEEVFNSYTVEGLYIEAVKEEVSGVRKATVRVTTDSIGSGVHIYRAE